MSTEDQAIPPVKKSDRVTKLLKRSRGATIADMTLETGWQAHSVRAFLTGLRKKGLVLDKEQRKSGEAIYRIAAATPAADAPATPDKTDQVQG